MKDIREQIGKPMARIAHFIADLHPWSALSKFIYGRDHDNRHLSTGERLGNGVLAALPIFHMSGGTLLEDEVANWLGRKGATVIRGAANGKDIELVATVGGQRLVGHFDLQVGNTLIQVKGVIQNPNLNKTYQQLTNQSRVAAALNMPFRVMIKGPIPPDLVQFMNKWGIKYIELK